MEMENVLYFGDNLNVLCFGDNLDVLREHVKPASVDLIYLDPPFNSDANYNVLFASEAGDPSEAQAEAFRDTWRWERPAAEAYDNVMVRGGDPAELVSSLKGWLGQNGMMAYLCMMTVRLLELKHVLKDTGSIFLHCDPTASHYLKLILDATFGHNSFQNEIVWSYRRWPTTARRFQRMHDTILFYSADPKQNTFNTLYQEPTESSKKRWGGKKQQVSFFEDGRRKPTEELEQDSAGVALNDVWSIPIIAPVSKERVGYPTQKPLALLERILMAASNEGDLVLDPFCGCGTTVEAAERLNRRWIGIDVTHYAISLIEERLKRGTLPSAYSVHGRPTDIVGARNLAQRDKHQFQWWASWLLGAQAYKTETRGADKGVDGRLYFKNGPYGTGKIIISVKGGVNVGVAMVRELEGVIQAEGAQMGLLITLAEPTQPMRSQAAAYGFVNRSAHGRLPTIQIATVEDLLAGRMPVLPPIPKPVAGSRKVRRKTRRDQLEIMFEIEGEKSTIADDSDYIDPRFLEFG